MGVTTRVIGTAGHIHKKELQIPIVKVFNKKKIATIASPQSPSVFLVVLECNPYCMSMMPVKWAHLMLIPAGVLTTYIAPVSWILRPSFENGSGWITESTTT